MYYILPVLYTINNVGLRHKLRVVFNFCKRTRCNWSCVSCLLFTTMHKLSLVLTEMIKIKRERRSCLELVGSLSSSLFSDFISRMSVYHQYWKLQMHTMNRTTRLCKHHSAASSTNTTGTYRCCTAASNSQQKHARLPASGESTFFLTSSLTPLMLLSSYPICLRRRVRCLIFRRVRVGLGVSIKVV